MTPFGSEVLSVLAGGWSARGLDLARLPGAVIAVNDAAVRAPRVDIAVSMDRLWTEYRWAQLQARRGPTWVRRAATKNVSGTWPGLVVFECDHAVSQFATEGFILNGTHSGFCALNLAWRLKPKRLFLFGFDHNRGPDGAAYWWGEPYPWSPPVGATTGGKYKAWAGQYALAADSFRAAGIDVVNASLTSAIGNFTKADPRKVLV